MKEKRFEKVVEDDELLNLALFAILSMIAFAFFPWFWHMFAVHGNDNVVGLIGVLKLMAVVCLGLFYLIAILVWGVVLGTAWDERKVYWREKE